MNDETATTRLPRGAIPSPRHMLAAAIPHVPDSTLEVPGSFLRWPIQMSYWGNNKYGDCVTAEEAFAKATATPQTFIPEDTAVSWADTHGYLNGAVISEVLQTMQGDGFQYNGSTYDDGSHNSVNWTDSTTLQSAIYSHGPVKIGVGAEYFDGGGGVTGSVTGGSSGWTMYDYPAGQQEDHCVSLCGYGNLTDLVGLFQQHGVTVNVPSGMPTGMCYAMFTWDSIGIIDEQSMLNMTGEAWIRKPVTIATPEPAIGIVAIIKNETTPLTPSIASLNGLMYVSWKGDGNDNLNVMCSADNGISWGSAYTSTETSPQAPALCAHNGNLYIAWKGDGNDNLNVAQVVTSGNSITGFTNKVTLGDTSSDSPSLASFGGLLYLAWKGSGNDNLNVMCSADSGTSWGSVYTSPETSPQAPCLCAGSSNLFIAWKGDHNDNLNVAQVEISGEDITGFTQKVTLGDTSPASPALAYNADKLYLSWKGDGNDSLNIMYSSDNGASFGNKSTSSETSPHAPSLCVQNDIVYIAWQGGGNNFLNIGQVNE